MITITNFPDYAVTKTGEVWSCPKQTVGFSHQGKFLKHGHSNGYHQVILMRDGIRHPKLVHRLVAEMFLPNPNRLTQINHIDGDKSNNCVENLEWVSDSENKQHKHKILKKGNGSNNPSAILNENKVAEILIKSKSQTGVSLAKEYGVHSSTIYHIIHKRHWVS